MLLRDTPSLKPQQKLERPVKKGIPLTPCMEAVENMQGGWRNFSCVKILTKSNESKVQF
jgi:hypothetical protein